MEITVIQHDIADIERTTHQDTRVIRIMRVDEFPDRFAAKVNNTGTCWVWTGAKNSRGYGCLGVDKKPWLAHRYSYTISVGPIPSGLTIDHLCRNIVCVRPSHLEAVTGKVNTLRGDGLSAINARRTECIHGHELTGWNLKIRRNGRRQCRTCHAITNRTYRARKAAA